TPFGAAGYDAPGGDRAGDPAVVRARGEEGEHGGTVETVERRRARIAERGAERQRAGAVRVAGVGAGVDRGVEGPEEPVVDHHQERPRRDADRTALPAVLAHELPGFGETDGVELLRVRGVVVRDQARIAAALGCAIRGLERRGPESGGEQDGEATVRATGGKAHADDLLSRRESPEPGVRRGSPTATSAKRAASFSGACAGFDVTGVYGSLAVCPAASTPVSVFFRRPGGRRGRKPNPSSRSLVKPSLLRMPAPIR